MRLTLFTAASLVVTFLNMEPRVVAEVPVVILVNSFLCRYSFYSPSASLFTPSIWSAIPFCHTGHIFNLVVKMNVSRGVQPRFWTSSITSSVSRIIVKSGTVGCGTTAEVKNV